MAAGDLKAQPDVQHARVAGHEGVRGAQRRRGGRMSQLPALATAGKRRTRLQFYAVLIGADCLAVVAGLLLGSVLRFGDALARGGLNLLAVLLPVFVVFALRHEAYTLRTLRSPQIGCKRAIAALAAAAFMIISVIFFMKTSSAFSRLALLLGVVTAAGLIVIFRLAAHAIGRRVLGGSPLSEVLILDDASYPAPEGWTVLEAAQLGLKPDIFDPRMLDRIGRLLKHADRVVVACRRERHRSWAMVLKGANIRGELVEPSAGELGVLTVSRYQEHSTLVVSTGTLNAQSRALKRLFDLVLGVTALVLLSPLMIGVAVAIRLEDGGPILFRQERSGLGNRLFRVLKFRSMRAAACDHAGNVSAARDDDRITKVGRFIRATSIDELPQLLNIVHGEMSFVGPRPHALGSLAGEKLFWEVDSQYWHRHAAKPGLTGLAQVRGFRGATASQTDLINRLQSDLEYLRNWTIWRDIQIILSTLRVVVHQNAF